MNGYISSRLKRLLLRAGLDVVRLSNSNSEIGITLRLIRMSEPDVIVDVGANIGQFASEILSLTSGIRLVSFEPLAQAHAQLTRKAAPLSRWVVAPPMALGSSDARINLNISANFVSSSILPMREAHVSAAPESAYVGHEEVEVKRLDSVIRGYCEPKDTLYLKIDTQGYESEVLQGATGIMHQIVAIQLEASFVELYANQKLAFDMIREVQQFGFKLFGVSNVFQDSRTGELLQANVHFLKPAALR